MSQLLVFRLSITECSNYSFKHIDMLIIYTKQTLSRISQKNQPTKKKTSPPKKTLCKLTDFSRTTSVKKDLQRSISMQFIQREAFESVNPEVIIYFTSLSCSKVLVLKHFGIFPEHVSTRKEERKRKEGRKGRSEGGKQCLMGCKSV